MGHQRTTIKLTLSIIRSCFNLMISLHVSQMQKMLNDFLSVLPPLRAQPYTISFHRPAHTYTVYVTSISFTLFSVTNKKPTEISITKVKQFEGSSAFVRRSQWSLDQLRQVNGIDPNRVSHMVIEKSLRVTLGFFPILVFSCLITLSSPLDSLSTTIVYILYCLIFLFFSYFFFLIPLSCAVPVMSQDCPEFDLTFENAFDQWVAGSAGDKCMFVQVLHNTCQRYSAERKPEFVNCQSKLLGGE